jgi:hypothetical protein
MPQYYDGRFPSSFSHQNLVHISLISHACHMPCYLILLQLICLMIFGEEYKIWSSSLCNFLHSPVTWSPFGPNFLHRTLFSNTLSLCSCFNVKDHVSHPYKTTGIFMILYILTFMVLDSRQEDRRLWTKW